MTLYLIYCHFFTRRQCTQLHYRHMTRPSQVGGAYDDSRDHSKHRGATNQGINTSLKY